MTRVLSLASRDRILVTGGAGFLGRSLVQALLDQTASDIVVLALPNERVPADWPARVVVQRGDITDARSVDDAVRGCAWVYHLAAMVGDAGLDELHQRVTVGGTALVLEAARRHGAAVILVTSICAYGDAIQRGPCPEDTTPGRAQGPYGRAKQGQEALARQFQAAGGQVCVVRPANIIGPGSGPWLDDVARALRQGLPAMIAGGRGNAALAGVDNVADFLVHVAGQPTAWGQAFHVHDGLAITWRQYFEDLSRMLKTPPPRSLPRPLAYAAARLTEPLFKRLAPRSRPPVTLEALNLIAWDSQLPLDKAWSLGWRPRVSYPTLLARIQADIDARGL